MAQEYIYLFKPTRENFLQTITPEEMMVMGQHMEYTQRLFAEGTIIQAGACLDASYGIVIFKADSEEAARAIYEADPAVKAGIVHSEFHAYKLVMLQGQGQPS